MSETVKVHISIEIETEGECDTGLTVEQWNAMTDAERFQKVREMWSEKAGNHDNGGMHVTTAGAGGI